MNSELKTKILAFLEVKLSSEGFECLDLYTSADGVVSLFIDRLDRKPVSIEDCVFVDRLVDGPEGLEQFFEKAFTLEVSSPGLDRPMRTRDHFLENVGKLAKVKLSRAIGNQKAGRGLILEVSPEDLVTLETSRGKWQFPLCELERANVIYQ